MVEEDTRTPLEIIQSIEEKGREATAALSRLQTLLATEDLILNKTYPDEKRAKKG